MAVTIVATPGSATANSFATEAEFIALAAAEPVVPTGTTTSGATCSETEKKALVRATRYLTRFPYDGSRVDTTQVLTWPRQYAKNPDVPWASELGDIDDLYFATTVIPARVVEATVRLAWAIIAAGTTDVFAYSRDDNIKRKKLDVIETEFFDRHLQLRGLARICPEALELIRPLLASNAGVLTLSRQ